MFAITKAEPCALRARSLTREMDLALLRSFRNLITVAEKSLKTDFRSAREAIDAAADRLAQTDSKHRLRASIYAIHNQMHFDMRSGNGPAVLRLARGLAPVPFHYLTVPTVRAWRSKRLRQIERDSLVDTFSRECRYEYNAEPDIQQPSSKTTRLMRKLVEETLLKLKRTDNETFAELSALISDIVIVESSTINAGSSFRTFGCLYLNVLRPDQNWTAFLEHLVHEAAHHHLFTVWWKDRIIENEGRQQLHPSPLRREPRPLSGVFHAMFVLARTIRTLRLFQSDTSYGPEVFNVATQYNNAKNPDSFDKKFVAAASVIEKHALLTPVGQQLFYSTRQMVSL